MPSLSLFVTLSLFSSLSLCVTFSPPPPPTSSPLLALSPNACQIHLSFLNSEGDVAVSWARLALLSAQAEGERSPLVDSSHSQVTKPNGEEREIGGKPFVQYYQQVFHLDRENSPLTLLDLKGSEDIRLQRDVKIMTSANIWQGVAYFAPFPTLSPVCLFSRCLFSLSPFLSLSLSLCIFDLLALLSIFQIGSSVLLLSGR
jgi:hypothetical protein